MSLNVKCPQCGSDNVQLSDVKRGHGCLWLILFGWLYVIWLVIKMIIGFVILICLDWWLAIVMRCLKKPYTWLSKGFFGGNRKLYFCHSCGLNFRK